jgi:hypothetical protein
MEWLVIVGIGVVLAAVIAMWSARGSNRRDASGDGGAERASWGWWPWAPIWGGDRSGASEGSDSGSSPEPSPSPDAGDFGGGGGGDFGGGGGDFGGGGAG